MRKTILFTSLFVLATAAHASERLLTGAEITEALSGHTYRHADVTKKVEQMFQASGDTFYSEDGAQSQGRWDVRGDKYCSQWPPSKVWSCYTISADGTVLTFISTHGALFPVKRLD